MSINLVAVISKGVKSKQNPSQGLIRYQFMEFIVRCAIDKYLKPKIVET